MIEIDSLVKRYDVPSGSELAVDDVSLVIGEDEFFTLVGPSGCGKTTILRCVAGLETPTSGTIKIKSQDMEGLPPHERNIGMMFQEVALYPHMTIMENISYPLKVRGVPKRDRHDRAVDASEKMNIPMDLLEKYPGELSGGQRQRAGLARTVVQDPDVFLMDEPLSDLDAQLKAVIRREIQKIHKDLEIPIIYVTHDQKEAMTMSDRLAVMRDGHFEQVGTPEDVFSRPETAFVAKFIGNPSMNLVRGTVVETDDGARAVTVDGDWIDLGRDTADSIQTGEDVDLGFRPECVEIGNDLAIVDIRGRIELIESLGDRYQLTMTKNGTELYGFTSSHEGLSEGEEVQISLQQCDLYLFNPESGATLWSTIAE